MSTLDIVLAAAAVLFALAFAAQRLRRTRHVAAHRGARRILVPFVGELDPTVLRASIRIAKAENAVLVPAYLLLVPLGLPEESSLRGEVEVAMPLLEAVEHAALEEGVPVDARIEKGRSLTHALQRLWEVETFDRVVAPAPTTDTVGFTPKDLIWILAHAPAETVILRPAPPDGHLPDPSRWIRRPRVATG
jgi:hypothetical protein